MKNSAFESETAELLKKERIYHMFSDISEIFQDDVSSSKLYSHGFFEIGIITEGSGIHFIDGKTVPCKVNDIYIVPPGTPHEYFLAEPGDGMVVRKLFFCPEDWFRGEVAVYGNKRYCYGVFKDGAKVGYAMLDSSMQENISEIFDSIECEMSDREDEWEEVIRTYLIQLFTFLARYINKSIKNTRIKSKDWDTVCEVVKIMESEFCDCDLSLATISKRVYVSPSHLSRIFKGYMGKLFSEYLREVRLRCAAKMLEETDMAVEKIVSQCGLRDLSAFYRKFREAFGMTPQIYRKVVKLSVEKTDENINKEDEEKIKMDILKEISTNIQCGKAKIVKELVQQAIDAGVNPADILNEGLLAGMSVIGDKFKNNEVYVPEVLVAARAMNMGTQILKPYLAAEGVSATGKVCIGTVQGDLHDIGKNLVKMMMEGKGLEVIDLGTDVSPETFVNTAIEENCQVICCSALLTTTMDVMREVVKVMEEKNIRDKVKIMIGGAPVSDAFCSEIGADVYTTDAASAADAAVEICKNN